MFYKKQIFIFVKNSVDEGKIARFDENEGLKPSQLAELLGINPAGISHILAGRNKPGFDLLQKILRRFPRINPDWLLLDSDKMYRDEPPAQSSAPQPMSQPASPGGDLFGLASGRHPLEEKRQPETAENATGDPAPQQRLPAALFTANVKRIVVLYDDQTFESFTPTTKR